MYLSDLGRYLKQNGDLMNIYPVLTIKETASYLKVSVESLRNLIKRGEIPVSRVGAQYRFRKDILDIWLKEAALSSYKGNLALSHGFETYLSAIESIAKGPSVFSIIERGEPSL